MAGYSGPPGSHFSQCVPSVQSCRDIQWSSSTLAVAASTDPYCIEGTYCSGSALQDDAGTACVPQASCPCYDLATGKAVPPGGVVQRSCADW